jgi:hypothetical protein
MYIRSNIAEKMWSSAEVLIPAKDLVGTNGSHRIDDTTPVTYFHIMFDDHQIIMANGCLSESFYTGPEALRALSNATRQELYAIFPELITMTGLCHTPARPLCQRKTRAKYDGPSSCKRAKCLELKRFNIAQGAIFVELFFKRVKRSRGNRVAHILHQILIVAQIVPCQ